MTFNSRAVLISSAAMLCFSVFTPNYLLAENETSSDAQQQIMDFSLSGFGDKGKKSWDVAGKSADMSSDIILLNNVTSNLYGDKEDVKLTAEQGNFDKNKSKLHLEKNVIITSSSGTKLTTNSLDWDRKNQVVSTLDKVNIERQNMFTTAQGAHGEPNLNRINLEKEVQVEIQPDSARKVAGSGIKNKITITCDGPLEIDYQKNIGTFRNNVKVDAQDSIIQSDTMEVYFLTKKAGDKEKTPLEDVNMGASIEKIIARGNVKITRGENVSFSEEATYTALDKKVTLTGKPRLVIYSTKDFKDAFTGD